MKLETFYAELVSRFDFSQLPSNEYEVDLIKAAAEQINVMTGGAFFRSIEKLPKTYVFPTEVDNG